MRKQKNIKKLGVIGILLLGVGIGSVVVGKKQQLEEVLVSGQNYLEENKYNRAMIKFQEAMDIYKKSASAYVGLGEAYIQKSEEQMQYEYLNDVIVILENGYRLTGDEATLFLLEKLNEINEVIIKEKNAIYYTTGKREYGKIDALYRMDKSGAENTKVLEILGTNVWDWEFVAQEAGKRSSLYFLDEDKLYKGILDGSNEQVLIANSVNAFETVKDEAYNKNWLLCEMNDGKLYKINLDKMEGELIEEGVTEWRLLTDEVTGEVWVYYQHNDVLSYVMKLEEGISKCLEHESIDQMIIYDERIIYDLPESTWEEDYKESPSTPFGYVFEYKENGETDAIGRYDFYRKVNITDFGDSYGPKIICKLGDVEEDAVYFNIMDRYEKIMGGYEYQIILVRQKNDGSAPTVISRVAMMQPWMGVEVEEEYIHLSTGGEKHEYYYSQIDKETLEEKDDGLIIASDEKYIYKQKRDGIYVFDRATEVSTKLTTLYPMTHYVDYKFQSAYKLGDYIYFNDYPSYVIADLTEERADIQDEIFRFNVETGIRENVNEVFSGVDFYDAMKDEEGYYYTRKTNLDGTSSVIRIKEAEEVEILLEETEGVVTWMHINK